MKYILGFDLGTSSCKAVMYNQNFEPVCDAKREYATFFPAAGCAEQPAEQWWDAFCSVARECIIKSGVAPADVAAVGIDSMGSVALPIDRNGNALHPGLLWMDRRSVEQCAEIEQKLGDRLFQITGNRNDPSNIAPKLLWFKETLPDIYQKTYKFLHANGYLVYRLTGVASQDRTECGLTLLCDIQSGKWSDEIIDALELDKEKLPDIYECHDVVGGITEEAALACGLCTGTPVVAGAMDCLASALGTASIHTGDVYIAGGTVTAVGIIQDHAQPHRALHSHNHIIPGKYVSVSAVDFGGGGLRWFRDTIGDVGYADLDKLADGAPPGNQGLIFLPYMVGQRSPLYNNATTGVMFGLTPDHTKKNLARMFMEGTAYAVRNILDYFRIAGNNPVCAKITGGISNSEVWTQIICDIIGVRIEHPAAVDVATLGSAVTAAVGVGLCKDYSDAFQNQKLKQTYEVNPANTMIYEKTFGIFKNLFNNILFSYEFANNVYTRISKTSIMESETI